jgi:hypothetical protein
MFYPSGRQRCVIGRSCRSSTRQVTRQKASGTRQVFVRRSLFHSSHGLLVTAGWEDYANAVAGKNGAVLFAGCVAGGRSKMNCATEWSDGRLGCAAEEVEGTLNVVRLFLGKPSPELANCARRAPSAETSVKSAV